MRSSVLRAGDMLEKAAKDDVTLDAEEFSSDFFRIYLFKGGHCPFKVLGTMSEAPA